MPVKSRKGLLVLALVVLFIPGIALAQKAKGSWEDVQQLRAGQQIQVVQDDGQYFTGTLLAVSDKGITLRRSGQEVQVARENVRKLSRVDNRGRKMALGGLLGGAAGAAIAGGMMAAAGSPEHTSRLAGLPTPVGIITGLVLGHRWGTKTIYQAPKTPNK